MGSLRLLALVAFSLWPLCARPQTTVPAFAIISFSVESNLVQLAVNSSTAGIYSLQSLDPLQGYWLEVTNQPGNGANLNFLDTAIPAATRFYRVAAVPAARFALFPAIPMLDSGAVSLPDAVVGMPYQLDVSAVGSGVAPYHFTFSGVPPDGISATIISNDTANARLRLSSDGSELIDGQRRQFNVTISDETGTNLARTYDLRVVPPPPMILDSLLISKAGEETTLSLQAVHGSGTLSWSLLSGTVPDGLAFTSGVFSGTPTPDAAERNENGMFTNVVQVADALTDRVTGMPAPRSTTQVVQHRVRLSYQWNLRANRPGSPAFGTVCTRCHSAHFAPNFNSTDAAAILIYVNAGSGGECNSFYNYVYPGDPGDSLLYQKVTGPDCGERMPLGGPYLNSVAINRIARWISELTDDDTD